MVSETQSESPSLRDLAPAGGGTDFQIVDETSAEQVESERKLLNNKPQNAPRPENQPHRQPRSEANAQPDTTDKRTLSEASQRTFTQDEVSKMQAAWSRQIGEARKTAEQATEQVQSFNLDAAVEANLRKQESQLAPGVGTEEARRRARSPENQSLVRERIASQHQLLQAEVGRRQAAVQQERQAKFVVARTLMQEHGLSADDFEVIASASTPQAMVKLARRLAPRDAAMRDRVPPESHETQLENGIYAGPATETGDKKLERIRSRPSWEWSDADLRYMQTGNAR